MLHSSTAFGPGTLRDLAAAHVSRLVMVPGIVTASSKPKHKATRIVLQCKVCRNTRGVAVAPGMGGAHVPRYCDGGGGAAGELRIFFPVLFFGESFGRRMGKREKGRKREGERNRRERKNKGSKSFFCPLK